MALGDPIVTCTTCGQRYYLAMGHKCVDLKPFGNTDVIGNYPTKLCTNCEDVSPGQVVLLDKPNGVCAVCKKEVRPEILKAQGMSEGKKHDSGKPRFELLPPEAVEQIVHVLGKGAEKYQARNWEKGISYGRVYGALQRHLNEFWKGNNTDPEWGLHHLAHAGCCLLFLLTYEARGMKEWDDRPNKSEGEA